MTVLRHKNIKISVKKRILRENLGELGGNNLNVVNETSENMDKLMELASDLFPYSQERLKFDRPVDLKLRSDLNNAGNPLGKTAYYDPGNHEIVIFVDNRHPKDILRSFSHELVHHAQNCRGEFDNTKEVGEGYAQKDEHLREMEREAYLEGNMIIRDWEDLKRENNKMLSEDKIRQMVREGLKKVLFEQEEIKEGGLGDDFDLSTDWRGRKIKDEEPSVSTSYSVHHSGDKDSKLDWEEDALNREGVEHESVQEEGAYYKRDDDGLEEECGDDLHKETLEEDDDPAKEKCAKAYRTGGSQEDYEKCLEAEKHDRRVAGGDPGMASYPGAMEEHKEVTVESRLRDKNKFLFEKLTKMWTGK